jgi:hypothetical protein
MTDGGCFAAVLLLVWLVQGLYRPVGALRVAADCGLSCSCEFAAGWCSPVLATSDAAATAADSGLVAQHVTVCGCCFCWHCLGCSLMRCVAFWELAAQQRASLHNKHPSGTCVGARISVREQSCSLIEGPTFLLLQQGCWSVAAATAV